MGRLAQMVVNHAKAVICFFFLICVVCGYLATKVHVNYNLQDYVPPDSPSTKSLAVMNEEFDQAIPNARVFVPDVSVSEALEIKDRIEALASVTAVMWLDDMVDITEPVEIYDSSVVEPFYPDEGAIYQVIATLDDTPTLVDQLRQIAGDGGAVDGQVVDLAQAQTSTSSEIRTIMMIMIPLGLALLCFSTRSWLDPPVLLLAISVAIVINMGTNIARSEISYLTQAVTAVLQLAVSMDYGIFLLHARDRAIWAGMDRKEALIEAITKAANSIVASSMTTILGFLALVFMSFQIGADMGITLAKGVLFSLVAVLFFMPAVIVVADPLLEKTAHRSLLPQFRIVGRMISRNVHWLIVIAVVLPLCFLAQSHNEFTYGNSAYPEGSRAGIDHTFMTEHFGRQLSMALMVPKGDPGREVQLENDVAQIDEVTSTLSYNSQAGHLIPSQLSRPDQLSMVESEHYSRIILTVDSDTEGDEAFAVVDAIRDVAERYYPGTYELVGESVVTADMKASVTHDNPIVNGLAIISIGCVLLLSFRSLSVPILLLLTIEGSIWINLTIPYISGTHLAFIGYLVVSTVQLGATVDYAILFTQHYLVNRRSLAKREAVNATIVQTFRTLLIPALILTGAGLTLQLVSTMEVVSQLGAVLGRGALLSFVMVNLFLPSLLFLFDPIIEKTTWKARFVRSR